MRCWQGTPTTRCAVGRTRLTRANARSSAFPPLPVREVPMKRNLVNFTRGSQLLGHFSFMFAAGLKGPLIIAALVISWTSWWTISAGLTDHEVYLC
ncbi:hypothetical protein Sala_0419 [Sphingopyxis alaskensis RB2256]|uniref:Uncharacterized protein n=2 Tax=Sphingopyxis alaskensis TaxID=117207 RepID=Q1GW32_SPHAL|nr:hypothetical protein Sala_0419 [Sphingopyxis alaskensis RB2256]